MVKIYTGKRPTDALKIIKKDKDSKTLTELERQNCIKSIAQCGLSSIKFLNSEYYMNDSEFNYIKNYIIKYHPQYVCGLYYVESISNKLSDDDKKAILISGLENSSAALGMLNYEKDREIRNLLLDSCLNDLDAMEYHLSNLNQEDLDYLYDKLKENILIIRFSQYPQGSKLRRHALMEKLKDPEFVKIIIEGAYHNLFHDEKEMFHDLYHEELFKFARRGPSRIDEYAHTFGKYLFDYEVDYLLKRVLDNNSIGLLQRLVDIIYLSEQNYGKINAHVLTNHFSKVLGGQK